MSRFAKLISKQLKGANRQYNYRQYFQLYGAHVALEGRVTLAKMV